MNNSAQNDKSKVVIFMKSNMGLSCFFDKDFSKLYKLTQILKA